MSETATRLYDDSFRASLERLEYDPSSTLLTILRHPQGPLDAALKQLEHWYAELPADWRQDLKPRLQSTTDETFLPAAWELYVHHLLTSELGHRVVEREAQTDGHSIDFLVMWQGRQVHCEAYCPTSSVQWRRFEQWKEKFQEKCRDALPPGYLLSVYLGMSFAADTDPEELAERIAEQVARKQPEEGDVIATEEPGGEDMEVTVALKRAGRPSGAMLVFARSVAPDEERLKHLIAAKIREERAVNNPVLLIVGSRGREASNERAWLNICYGASRYAAGGAPPKLVPLRRHGGVFTAFGRDGLVAPHLSGIVASTFHLSYEVGRFITRPAAYLNPVAEHPLQPEFFGDKLPVWVPRGRTAGEVIRLGPPPEPKIDAAVRRVIDAIARNYDPERIIVFGSRAAGTAWDDSDVDILVVKRTEKSPRERTLEVLQTLPIDRPAVDVLVRTPEEIAERLEMGDSFFHDVVRQGIVVYERDASERVGRQG